MFNIPAFFNDHRIDQDADERTIKRAYATALKKIDQHIDLEGFQKLREGYEHALAWAQNKDSHEQFAVDTHAEVISEFFTATVPNLQNQALNTLVNENEHIVYAADIARSIFNEFLHSLSEKSEEMNQAEVLLRMYLDDERLVNVEIRDLFECLMAEYLSQGWQAGNGDLFGAAVKLFCWDLDRNKLVRFHEVGYYLDRAVDEMNAFNLQKEARCSRQIKLIHRARNDASPTKQFLREEILLIKDLLVSYPIWLAMVTKFENLQNWHKQAEEYKFLQPPKLSRPDVPDKFFSLIDLAQLIFFSLCLLSTVIRFFSE